METAAIINLIVLAASVAGVIWGLVLMYKESNSFTHIKFTRKDTGKSITISTTYSREQTEKLVDFLKDSK